MTRFDLTPLFRTTVGFDRMFQLFDEIADAPTSSYPPYNIEKLSDDRYRISMAVAGFGADDLEVELKQNQLTVRGSIGDSANASTAGASPADKETSSFLHRGIAERAFTRQFSLAEHVRVEDAQLEKGLLHIELLRDVPEEAKARRIAIGVANDGPSTPRLGSSANAPGEGDGKKKIA